MSQCYNAGDFRKYFNENMRDLGLPVPVELFDTYNTAVAHAMIMVETLRTLGKGATVAELIGATTGLEKLKVAAAFGAAAYTGAAIGSIAVAGGRSLGCGSRMADLFVLARQSNLKFDGFTDFYRHNPQVLDKGQGFRQRFAVRAKSSPSSFEYA